MSSGAWLRVQGLALRVPHCIPVLPDQHHGPVQAAGGAGGQGGNLIFRAVGRDDLGFRASTRTSSWWGRQ